MEQETIGYGVGVGHVLEQFAPVAERAVAGHDSGAVSTQRGNASVSCRKTTSLWPLREWLNTGARMEELRELLASYAKLVRRRPDYVLLCAMWLPELHVWMEPPFRKCCPADRALETIPLPLRTPGPLREHILNRLRHFFWRAAHETDEIFEASGVPIKPWAVTGNSNPESGAASQSTEALYSMPSLLQQHYAFISLAIAANGLKAVFEDSPASSSFSSHPEAASGLLEPLAVIGTG